MRHVGRLGGGDGDLAVRRDRHALGLDADVDLRDHLAGLDVDDGRHRVVLVGDLEVPVVRLQHELLRILARGQVVQDLARLAGSITCTASLSEAQM